MKIGVLYPRSKAYPEITADFVDGIKAALEHFQISKDVLLVSESIGFGGNEKEVYEKAEKLLSLEKADMLVAYVDLRVLSILEPLLLSSGKLMIVVNAGANYPENWIPQPNIIFLTLQHSFLCWLNGVLAAKNKNAGAALATTFFDAGYLHIAALTKSYMNNGGSIQYNYVNNDAYNENFHIQPLVDFLSSDKETETLLCVFDAKPASLFYDRLNNYKDSSKLKLFVSPMMLEKHTRETTGKGYNFSIEGYLPYNAAAQNKSDKEFKNSFASHSKNVASIFALQGWETGLILHEIFINCKKNFTDGGYIKDHLASIVFESPRGNLKLDKETQFFLAPVYKGVLKNNSSEIIITLDEKAEGEWKNFTANPMEGASSGWTNIYLCY